ncbi:THO complex subunit 6 [Drosophila miranda]|uniref:GA19018 n=1 Tax=Drosophila miranda TaxID=7229 RepID=D0QWS8_DROMI|nr:THO complex subunit 6 [Drosophila miranda]ACN94776.1 GA19018 [Drosophila miranda]
MKETDLKRAYNNVLSQALSSSQQYLFSGNLFGDIFVLSLKELEKGTEEPPSKLKIFPQGSALEINCLAFRRDFLIVGTVGVVYGLQWNEDDEKLSTNRLWEVKIPMQADAVEVPDVNSLWLSPDTDTLFAGCGDGIIYQISLEDGRVERDYRGHTDYVHSVVGNSNGQIFSGAEDGTVRVWTTKQMEQTSMIEPYKTPKLHRPDWGKWIGSVAVNDDWLLCGGGPRASIFHLRSLGSTCVLDFPGGVHVCDFVDDGVFIGGEHNHVHSYTLNGALQANIPVEHTACYSIVWQTTPMKIMSIAGFSNRLHILKDFRFLDRKIDLYGNVEGEEDAEEGDEEEFEEIESFNCAAA